jgi:type II secretory pathway pseudopilin PulG
MRRGFTLVEMLTVIGIIILLVSILLPVIGSVRRKAYAADTAALLNNLAAGIQRYHADFNAYPGPLHNGQIYGGSVALPTITARNVPGGEALVAAKITQSENLVLGLLGGMRVEGTPPSLTWVFDFNAVGDGPASLNPLSPKKSHAYMDRTNLSQGNYKDDAADADDSVIPEFLDRFPDGMPVLYLRAKTGAPTGTATGGTSETRGIVTNSTTYSAQGQYDLNQIIGYTDKVVGGGSGRIGVGKEEPKGEYAPPALENPLHPDHWKHGLRTVDPNASYIPNPTGSQFGTVYKYPYDLYAYLRHPSIPNTPRNKDGFILISAGPDRFYGTKDDIQQPPFR